MAIQLIMVKTTGLGSPPGIPQNIVVTPGEEENDISWDTVSGATSYTVYWDTSPGVSLGSSSLTPTASLTINHPSLTGGQPYYYKVLASNAGGDSSLSAEANGTPTSPVVGGWRLDGPVVYDSVSVGSLGSFVSKTRFSDDGTSLYVCVQDSQLIRQYTVAPAWDLTGLGASVDLDVSSLPTSGSYNGYKCHPTDISFNSTGTTAYIAGLEPDNTVSLLHQVSLSTPWLITSATWVHTIQLRGYDSDIGISMNPLETRFLVADVQNAYIEQWSMTAGTLSTASIDGGATYTTTGVQPLGVVVDPTGTKLFFISDGTGLVYQDSMSSWDLSTATSSGRLTFDYTNEEPAAAGFDWKYDDGLKMYIIGFVNQTLYQYSTP